MFRIGKLEPSTSVRELHAVRKWSVHSEEAPKEGVAQCFQCKMPFCDGLNVAAQIIFCSEK